MTESQVYWWMMLDNLSGWGTFFAVAFFILALLSFIMTIAVVCSEYDSPSLKTRWVTGLAALPVFALLVALAAASSLIPDSRQYAVIKILPKIANSELAKEIPGDAKDMYDAVKVYFKELVRPTASLRKTVGDN